MTRIYLFRHGQTHWNAQGRMQGHVDIALNDTGRAQARALAQACQGRGIAHIASSDLARARETAEIVAAHLGVGYETTPDFRELHMGQAQGRTYRESVAALGESVMRAWFDVGAQDAQGMRRALPGGESRAALLARFERGVVALLKDPEVPEVFAISTHGGALRTFLLARFPEVFDPEARIPNAAMFLARVDEQGGWHLEGLVHGG